MKLQFTDGSIVMECDNRTHLAFWAELHMKIARWESFGVDCMMGYNYAGDPQCLIQP